MTAPIQIAKLQADVALITADSAGVQLPALPDLAQQVNALAPDVISTPGRLDPILITDAPGGLTKGWVYGKEPAGFQPLVPWLPLIGQEDIVVSTSSSVKAGFTGALPFVDVTGACDGSQPIQIGLKAAAGTVITLAARQSNSPPTLSVLYDDGSREILSAFAECEVDTSTAYMIVNKPTLEISSKGTPWFRFMPNKKVVSASLNLTAVKVWQAGTFAVLLFNPGYLVQPSVLAPWGGTQLLKTECFEDGPAYIKDHIILPANDLYGQRKFVNVPASLGGGRAVEISTDPRAQSMLELKYGIWPEAFEAWFSYDMLILPGALAALQENGKLPGFGAATRPDDAYMVSHYGLPFPPGTIGTQLSGNGGTKVNGKDDWSNRGDYVLPFKPPHPLAGRLPLSSYVYHPDFSVNDYNGEQMPWSNYGNGTLDIGVFHNIAVRQKMNTIGADGKGNHDGEIEARIDGKLVLFRTGIRFRDGPPYTLTQMYGVPTDLLIRCLWFCFYHGGHAYPLLRLAFCLIRNILLMRVS